MIDMLSYPFMQRALLAALLTGLIAPAIGTYIVQRRLSLLGDGLGHVAIAGVGLAFLTGSAPLPIAVVVCVLGAVDRGDPAPAGQGDRRRRAGHPVLRRAGRRRVDVGHRRCRRRRAVAVPVRLADHRHRRRPVADRASSAVVVLVPTLGLAPQLFAVCADEEFARTQGLRVRVYNVLIVVLAAITVTARDAHGRAAAGQRPDGGAGGGRPATWCAASRRSGLRDGRRGVSSRSAARSARSTPTPRRAR